MIAIRIICKTINPPARDHPGIFNLFIDPQPEEIYACNTVADEDAIGNSSRHYFTDTHSGRMINRQCAQRHRISTDIVDVWEVFEYKMWPRAVDRQTGQNPISAISGPGWGRVADNPTRTLSICNADALSGHCIIGTHIGSYEALISLRWK